MPEGPKTTYVPSAIRLQRPKLVVLSGARKGQEIPLTGFRSLVGSSSECQVLVKEAAPIHAELLQEEEGLLLVDRSGDALLVNGKRVHEAVVGSGATFQVAGTELKVQESGDALSVLPSASDRFGSAYGRSLPMREVFGVLEALADTEATILLMGETGSGKDVLARAVHAASSRAEHPIQTLDCGAIAPTLVEAELFGHERGAFTGAEERRAGAFERADGGTLFLDEIGELPLDVQPKLLRALEEHIVQPVGGSEQRKVDVRIVAATKRDLREEVRRGRFREDLWFRLAVVTLTLPPLRERKEDIPLLVDTFKRAFEARHPGTAAVIPSEELSMLQAHDWPGNVRELKNTVERALWLARTGDGTARFMVRPMLDFSSDEATPMPEGFDGALSFSEHKQGWEDAFEKSYLGWLLARSDGSLSKAARLASMDRKHLRNLLRRHELYEEPD